MSSLNYLELCRLCLVKDRVQIPIFEEEGDIRQIFLKIAACLPVKVGTYTYGVMTLCLRHHCPSERNCFIEIIRSPLMALQVVTIDFSFSSIPNCN